MPPADRSSSVGWAVVLRMLALHFVQCREDIRRFHVLFAKDHEDGGFGRAEPEPRDRGSGTGRVLGLVFFLRDHSIRVLDGELVTDNRVDGGVLRLRRALHD